MGGVTLRSWRLIHEGEEEESRLAGFADDEGWFSFLLLRCSDAAGILSWFLFVPLGCIIGLIMYGC